MSHVESWRYHQAEIKQEQRRLFELTPLFEEWPLDLMDECAPEDWEFRAVTDSEIMDELDRWASLRTLVATEYSRRLLERIIEHGELVLQWRQLPLKDRKWFVRQGMAPWLGTWKKTDTRPLRGSGS